jgi:glycosyltransferase involved in cell wall biosynthesis
LLGHVGNPAEALSAADLLIIPSAGEGIPLALLESLAMGVPVVACRAGAIEEELPEECGVLVDAGQDEQERLAEAILELLDDPARRQAMSRSAVERAEQRHSLDRARAAYRELIAEVTS